MRHLLFAGVMFVNATTNPQTAVRNATELRDLLSSTATAPVLSAIETESGCGPEACVVEVEQLLIQRDKGFFEHRD